MLLNTIFRQLRELRLNMHVYLIVALQSITLCSKSDADADRSRSPTSIGSEILVSSEIMGQPSPRPFQCYRRMCPQSEPQVVVRITPLPGTVSDYRMLKAWLRRSSRAS